MPRTCTATPATINARRHPQPYHCHRTMAKGTESTTTKVAQALPQKEKLARIKPPSAIDGSGFAMKAGNMRATPGKKYSREPVAPIQAPTANSAVSGHFQLSFLAIVATTTKPRGSKRRKLRNSENMPSHGTFPMGAFAGLAPIHPHNQKQANSQTQAGDMNMRRFGCGIWPTDR